MGLSLGRWAGVAGAAVLAGSSVAYAAGFEKITEWGARQAALAGSSTSFIDGAQSLAFNPAGLARPTGYLLDWKTPPTGIELNLQVSPTLSRFKGPILTPAPTDGEWQLLPVFGALVSYRPIEKVGIGAGVFVTGGTSASYEDVSFAGLNPNFDTLQPDLKAELRIIDASLGAGVEVIPGLRLGAAWRFSWVSGELASALPVRAPAGSPPGTPPFVALVSARFEDLNDTAFNGFRVGVQYAPKDLPFGAGVHWRTPVNFTVDGTLRGQLEGGVGPNGPAGDLPQSPITIASQFPSQIVAGAFFAFNHRLRLIGEYAFTHYKVDSALRFTGSIQTPPPPAGLGAVPVPDITLDWENQHNARFAVEWAGETWALRGGYGYTSRVTNPDFARPTLASPGTGNTFTIGGGMNFLDSKLILDAAGEISAASGDGTNEFGVSGEFSTIAYVLHLGMSYTWDVFSLTKK